MGQFRISSNKFDPSRIRILESTLGSSNLGHVKLYFSLFLIEWESEFSDFVIGDGMNLSCELQTM